MVVVRPRLTPTVVVAAGAGAKIDAVVEGAELAAVVAPKLKPEDTDVVVAAATVVDAALNPNVSPVLGVLAAAVVVGKLRVPRVGADVVNPPAVFVVDKPKLNPPEGADAAVDAGATDAGATDAAGVVPKDNPVEAVVVVVPNFNPAPVEEGAPKDRGLAAPRLD